MIARDPAKYSKWAEGQPGGPTNPLGARAIYLTSGGKDYGYRIHGTPDWQSIGSNASSGCIRMINQDVIDLYGRLQGGEKVIVLTASGEMPQGLYIPKPPAPKVAAKPAAVKRAAVKPSVDAALPALPPPPPLDMDLIAPVPVATPTTAAAVTGDLICKSALVNGVCPPAKTGD